MKKASAKKATAKKAGKSPADETKKKSAKDNAKIAKPKKTSKAKVSDDEDGFGDFDGEEDIKLDDIGTSFNDDDDDDDDDFYAGDDF